MSLPPGFRERMVLPAMAAPMFLVSGVDLAVACCKAGIIGSLTRNHCRDDAEFEAQLVAVRERLARARGEIPEPKIGPLAANVSIGMDRASRAAALDACRRHGVDLVVTAGGDPAPVAAMVHDWGGRLFHDVTTLRFAEKAIAAGVDGVVAIGAGGGGHSGIISHLALVPQIRAMFSGTIVMAGAIATGAAIRAAEVLGADLAYLGTRFIATRESMADEAYKAMIVRASPADLLYTAAVNGLPAMWMAESLRAHGLDPANLPTPQGHGSAHLPPGAKPWQTVWSAGQGVGLISDVPAVSELVARLVAEYRAAVAIPAFDQGA